MINLQANLILINIAANQIAKECDNRIGNSGQKVVLRGSNLLKSSSYAIIGRLSRKVLNKLNDVIVTCTMLNLKNITHNFKSYEQKLIQ